MSSPLKKPPPPGATGRRSSINPSSSPASASRSPSRASIQSSSSVASGLGISRAKGKGGKGGPPLPNGPPWRNPDVNQASNKSSTWLEDSDNDSKYERMSLAEDLKDRLVKAEKTSDEYQRQIEVLQLKLDEALQEQHKLEDYGHEQEEMIENLTRENKDTLRQSRAFENLVETEKAANIKCREVAQQREEELLLIIQRLKESLSRKNERDGDDVEKHVPGEPNQPTNGQQIGQLLSQHDKPTAGSHILSDKDRIIQSLQLELAETQIKLAEVGNIGSGRIQELEGLLLETRMANARLTEGNESIQLLLSEKSLNGDLSRDDLMHCSTIIEDQAVGSSKPRMTLADELNDASDIAPETQLSPEKEIKTLKDQNKALSLYITKLIERLLNHKDFESILDQTPDLMSGPPKLNTEKELPAPPPKRETMNFSVLSRAKSVTAAPNRARPRPMSYMPVKPSTDLPLRGTNASITAKSTLQRSNSLRSSSIVEHSRESFDQDHRSSALAQLQGCSGSSMSPSQLSPTIVSPKNNMFDTGPKTTNSAIRIPSGSSSNRDTASDSNDLEGSLESRLGSGAASPPRAITDRPAAVMAGNKPKPLRLVQESAEAQAEMDARKKANRASWVPGWLSKAKTDYMPQQSRTFSG